MKRPIFILENGSYSIKAGFSGDDEPKSIIRNIIGRDINDPYRKVFVGKDTINNENLQLSYPIQRGLYTNINDLEHLYNEIIYNQLKIDPKDFSLLISESILNNKDKRQKILQLIFETFQFPSLYFNISSFFLSKINNILNGICLQSGGGFTSILPIVDGYPIQHAIQTSKLSGNILDNFMEKLLNNKLNDFNYLQKKEICRNIKENKFFISLNFQEDLQLYSLTNTLSKNYFLPNNKEILLNQELIICPEKLFDPKIDFEDLPGIPELIQNSLKKCDINSNPNLFKNIYLFGNNTKFQGFKERLSIELLKFLTSNDLNIFNDFFNYSSFNAASKWSLNNDILPFSITFQEYSENGDYFRLMNKFNYLNNL